MIVLEINEDKFGKLMKLVSKISESSECLESLLEDLSEDLEYEEQFEYGNRYGNRKKYDDGSMYGSRYSMYRSTKRK